MKTCKSCGENKEDSCFERYRYKCKKCTDAYRKAKIDADPEARKRRAFRNRELRELHPERYRSYLKSYRKKNPHAHSEYRKRWPEKERPRRLFRYAVRVGKITNPHECQKCNTKTFTQAHHPDYAKPYDVIWLCPRCHGIEHAIFKPHE